MTEYAPRLSPETPGIDIQQACGTGLQAAIQVANKIALGVIDVGVAGGTDTTSDAPVAISDKLFDLVGVKSTIGAGIGDLAFFAVFAFTLDGAKLDHGRRFLALAHMAPTLRDA